MDDSNPTATFRFDPIQQDTAVMVVADNDTLREQLGRPLERGFRWRARQKWDRSRTVSADHQHTHLVVLDWQMPEMAGIALLATICQKQPTAAGHTFLLLTSWYDLLDDRLEQFPRSLHVTPLRKPFAMEDLLRQIAQAATALDIGYSAYDSSATD